MFETPQVSGLTSVVGAATSAVPLQRFAYSVRLLSNLFIQLLSNLLIPSRASSPLSSLLQPFNVHCMSLTGCAAADQSVSQ